ncbi:HlyD family secretion protein [Rhizobium sp. P40RR-XXII]|uniref:HlyD family secretion protein n=1 Tax=unclassified Rhizobium TaxID=2613769 RepID=UPI0014578B69|nr:MULTISPECIES: HlyD family secretion protein [unclassified Rhizobium]NLR84519.1 HlyD family secretion protein [Rhizobium sp. P28RR-XV]NLS16574.1 HlyD family secretion protein [Rhizobium sp. P40RR-XXII]
MADNQPNIMETKPARRKQRPFEDADRQADSSVEKRPSFVHRHPFWILSGIVVLVALIVGAWFGWKIYFYPYESTDDAFVGARSFSVAAKVAGYVAEVPVTDNQHVKAGDVILRIEPRDYQIALDQANGQVEVARAAVDSAGAQIEAANASVDVAKAQQNSSAAALQYAQQESARQQQLVKSGSGSEQAVQQAASTLQQDQASLAQMQASVTSALKNKTVAEAQKSSALASLKQAQAQAEEAQQNLSYTTITAAQPGRVVRLTGAKGQYIDAGQAISTFVPDDIWITANFKETQLTDMRPGQPVELTIDAYPEHKLHGKVASVQPGSGTAFSLLPAENATGNYVKVTQRVPVKIIVDKWPADVAIGPGMSVVPTVTVRPRS